ncbi:DEAD/DEAH box helicase family protein [Streptomyces pseudovenezuelae]|uniref:DEAD/DEAH box helicase family protein n=1 Tax=Streptomyces pseudovenezuelae TaxID=67350 RepID=UPI002E812526|nr:DEAD/DEAH box helicase family protein [Streptomyces pseudovenezuelae]WUA88705.1 DEAD/DEAH box helicase family protein [Streptomyces pseudovenezuelae]
MDRDSVDDRLRQLAKASPNFGRLYSYQPLLAVYGSQAELTVLTNPNAAYVSAGQFGEVLAEEFVTRTATRVEGTTQFDRLNALTRAGVLVGWSRDAFDKLRRGRNDAAHNHLFDTTKALEALKLCWQLGDLFDRAMGGTRTVAAFVPPTLPTEVSSADPEEMAQLQEALEGHRRALTESRVKLSETSDRLEAERRARGEAEELIAHAERAKAAYAEEIEGLRAQVAELRATHQRQYDRERVRPRKVASSAREAIVERAQRPAPLNEVQAREKIDAMLAKAGWRIQDKADANPLAGKGVAIREFTLATGRADYVLYVDGKIVGVIEAKREGTALAGALAQNERYAAGVLKDHAMAVWRREEPFAFRYVTTGAETYFLNRVDPEARSREVFAFHRPETVAAWMKRADENPAAPTFRAALRTGMPLLETHGLRMAQVDAVTGLEGSLAADRPRALIQMATGAGKTFTAVTETYRLLRHAGARRVLFLVDRNNLGRQAHAEFDKYRTPDENRKLTDLYNVDMLGRSGLQETSSVVISTIQRMYALLKGEPVEDGPETDEPETDDLKTEGSATGEGQDAKASNLDETYAADEPVTVEYNPDVPIESFDVIVVDECHRSIYGLWRGVLEYFDAHLVGLTATPTRQTKGFFDNNMVSQYTYEQAVADGVNVDFDIVRLGTSLDDDGGARIEAGTTVRIRDRQTRAQRYEELDEDFDYTLAQLGRTVITEDAIRAVLTTYRSNWQRWFPGRADLPKTLIFAAGDDHADEVLKQVKQVFSRGDEFAKKITYRSRQNGDDPDSLINDLRNSPRLRVAVTVDMIATGTDVKPLECVIFLRAIKSPVLFEQMKGRGARSIDPDELKAVTPEAATDLAKDRFVLIDAVGVTDSPLVDARPLIPAGEGSVSLSKLLDKAGTRSLTADEAETLARRLARIDRQLGEDDRGLLAQTSGGFSLADLARRITDAVDVDTQDRARHEGGPELAKKLVQDAVAPLTSSPELRKLILEIRHQQDLTYDETTEVRVTELREIPREERARKALAEWNSLLAKEERDENAAIRVALGSGARVSPREARNALKELAGRIRATNRSWTTGVLWEHYEQLGKAAASPGKEAGLGDLIRLIRYELGADDELRPYRTVVEERFEGWLLRQRQAGVEFTDDQLWWLERMKNAVSEDIGIEPGDFGHAPFSERGGGRGFMRAFGGKDKALELLDELNQELG